jgi:hypothetical protein
MMSRGVPWFEPRRRNQSPSQSESPASHTTTTTESPGRGRPDSDRRSASAVDHESESDSDLSLSRSASLARSLAPGPTAPDTRRGGVPVPVTQCSLSEGKESRRTARRPGTSGHKYAFYVLYRPSQLEHFPDSSPTVTSRGPRLGNLKYSSCDGP